MSILRTAIILLTLYGSSMPDTLAQKVNTWERGDLSFVTKKKIKQNDSEDKNVYDADNDGLGINIEIVDFEGESPEFLNDPQYGCKEICEDMEMEFRENGGEFISFYKNHYIVCFDKEPVITAVILREDIQKVYEISIWCYEIEVEEGVEILKSLKFTHLPPKK